MRCALLPFKFRRVNTDPTYDPQPMDTEDAKPDVLASPVADPASPVAPIRAFGSDLVRVPELTSDLHSTIGGSSRPSAAAESLYIAHQAQGRACAEVPRRHREFPRPARVHFGKATSRRSLYVL